MQIRTKVQPKALGRALGAVKPALSRRGVIAALAGVRLTLTEDGLQIEAADRDVYARTTVGEVHSSSGALDCLVTHRELADVVKACGGDSELELELQPGSSEDDGVLACRSGRRQVRLQTLRLADFPAHPDADSRRLFTGPGGPLYEAIERVGRFASSDEARAIMCGVNVDWEDGLRLVGCDGYRLAAIPAPAVARVRKRARTESRPDPNRVTISARGLLLAARSVRNADMVEVLECDRYAIVQSPTMRWAIRILDGQYPRWRDLTTGEFRHTIRIPASELAEACGVATTFLGDTPARLHADGDVKLYGKALGGVEFEETLAGADVELDGTETFEIGFRAELLRSIALACKGEELVFRLADPAKAVVADDGEDRYVLMPIRLN